MTLLEGMSSALSDRELRLIGERRTALEANAYDYSRHGFSVGQVANVLARESLQLRRIVRAFVEQHRGTDLAEEAVRYLGFNITEDQR